MPATHERRHQTVLPPARYSHLPLISRRQFVRWLEPTLLWLWCAVTYNQRLSPEGVADALAAAWQLWLSQPGYFQSAAHLRQWLKRTARLRSIDHYRRRVNSREQPTEASWLAGRIEPQKQRQQGQRWSPADQAEVFRALQRLPAPERLVLEWAFYDQLTNCEIASKLWGEDSPAAGLRVWRLRQRALTHLHQLLDQDGFSAAA